MDRPEVVRVHASELIELTEHETELFQELVNAVQAKGLSTVIRVAGGWVRDKVKDRSLVFSTTRI